MSKALATLPASDADLHAARFLAMHNAATARGMEFKLLAYFAGLEIIALKDAYIAEHGETRGGGKKEKSPGETFLTLKDWMQEKTGVSKATAYRYTAHYEGIAAAHPEAAAKLNAYYQKQVAALAIGDGSGSSSAALALLSPDAGKLPAKAIEELTAAPDVWGLHELFAEDDTDDDTDESDDDDTKGRKLSPLVKFWAKELCARLKADEFLRLPKQHLRRIKGELEAAAARADAALKGKA